MSWSLSLSGEWISWNWPGREVRIKSEVFLTLGKGITCSKPWSSIMSSNICPSEWLSMLPDLLSLAGQAISLKLESSMWTDGSFFTFMLRLNMIKLISKQVEVFDSPIWLLIPTCYIHVVRRFIYKYFYPNWFRVIFQLHDWHVRDDYEWVTSPRHHESFLYTLYIQVSGSSSEVAIVLSIFDSWIATRCVGEHLEKPKVPGFCLWYHWCLYCKISIL